jgi:hypothetical protein
MGIPPDHSYHTQSDGREGPQEYNFNRYTRHNKMLEEARLTNPLQN